MLRWALLLGLGGYVYNSPVPLVWSALGPVEYEGVDPLYLVQSNSSSTKWNHWQNPCSKSHGKTGPPENERQNPLLGVKQLR